VMMSLSDAACCALLEDFETPSGATESRLSNLVTYRHTLTGHSQHDDVFRLVHNRRFGQPWARFFFCG